MQIGRYIGIHRHNPRKGFLRSINVHRFYVVADRDRHKLPFVEIGAGQYLGPGLMINKHTFRVTLGWPARPEFKLDLARRAVHGSLSRIWFEGELGPLFSKWRSKR